MKELKEFTVEQLEQYSAITSWELLHSNVNLSDLRSLAKIALAAKQGMKQPVCFIGKQMLHDLTEENRSCGRVWISGFDELERVDRIPLYTTPPLNHTEQNMVAPDGFTEIQLIKAMTWINRVRAENPNMKEARTCAELILRLLPAAPKSESE